MLSDYILFFFPIGSFQSIVSNFDVIPRLFLNNLFLTSSIPAKNDLYKNPMQYLTFLIQIN